MHEKTILRRIKINNAIGLTIIVTKIATNRHSYITYILSSNKAPKITYIIIVIVLF